VPPARRSHDPAEGHATLASSFTRGHSQGRASAERRSYAAEKAMSWTDRFARQRPGGLNDATDQAWA
jgi:hypothetical protein